VDIDAGQLDAPHHDPAQVDTVEPRAAQVDGAELRAAEVDALEPGAAEIGTNEVSHETTVTSRADDPPLAAIDNAQAVPPWPAAAGASSPHVAGTAAGLGAGEAERRSLSEAEAERIVRAEVAERHAAAHDYQRMGHAGQAGRLRHEAGVLMSAMATGEGRQASQRADQLDDAGP